MPFGCSEALGEALVLLWFKGFWDNGTRFAIARLEEQPLKFCCCACPWSFLLLSSNGAQTCKQIIVKESFSQLSWGSICYRRKCLAAETVTCSAPSIGDAGWTSFGIRRAAGIRAYRPTARTEMTEAEDILVILLLPSTSKVHVQAPQNLIALWPEWGFVKRHMQCRRHGT